MSWLWAAVLGCVDPSEGGEDSAIEITGYLDASRVAWTTLGTQVQAAGLEGAASPGSVALLENETAGETAEGPVGDLGTFVVAVAAAAGDHLVLYVDDAPAEDEVTHDVPTHPPFPETEYAVAHTSDAHPDLVVVEVAFVAPQPDGHVWAANHRVDAVVVLDRFDGDHLHGGHLVGVAGDWLLLWWVPLEGVESQALEVEVAPSAD